jgi:hypothetical protein
VKYLALNQQPVRVCQEKLFVMSLKSNFVWEICMYQQALTHAGCHVATSSAGCYLLQVLLLLQTLLLLLLLLPCQVVNG